MSDIPTEVGFYWTEMLFPPKEGKLTIAYLNGNGTVFVCGTDEPFKTTAFRWITGRIKPPRKESQ